jgi:hypothetical protein
MIENLSFRWIVFLVIALACFDAGNDVWMIVRQSNVSEHISFLRPLLPGILAFALVHFRKYLHDESPAETKSFSL